MGYVSFSIPKEIVLRFNRVAQFKNFVETGTYKGQTSFWASQYFNQVYTIEIDPEISRKTASSPGCPANIQFMVGDSKDVLPDVVEKLKSRAVFWLDGHWCNMSVVGKDSECPLLDELRSLKDLDDALIMIDDARAFLGPLSPPHDSSKWPRIDNIFLLLKSQFPNNLVTIMDDVIYCIPTDLIGVFDQYWQETYTYRFGNSRTRFIKRIGMLMKQYGLKK